MKVADILRVKGSTLFTVAPQATLWSAVQTMAENDIGSVVVMDRGQLVGMLTFREVLGKVHANGGVVGGGTVRESMAPPRIVGPDTDVMELRRMMLEEHARYLPVLDGSTLFNATVFSITRRTCRIASPALMCIPPTAQPSQNVQDAPSR